MNTPAVPDKSRRRPLSIRTLVRSSRAEQSAGRALALCDALLSEQGEVSGRRLAAYALSAYQSLDDAGRDIFFDRLVTDFGPNAAEVERAAARYRADASGANLVRLQAAVEPPPQIVPALNLVDRLVLDQTLEDHRRGVPVDALKDQEPAIEPRPEQVQQIRVDTDPFGVRGECFEHLAPHLEKYRRASGRHVGAAEQFLTRRFHGVLQLEERRE